MNLFYLATLLFGSSVIASGPSRLYAASYAGTVSSLSLTKSGPNYELTTLSQTTDCGTSPSWLMLDKQNEVLYCLDEGVDLPNATLTSFQIKSNGSLARITQLSTLSGPVASEFYSAPGLPGRKFFAVAHYSGSAVTTYTLDPASGHFDHVQTFTFEMAAPGPVPARQDAPHPHGVTVDPTGQFVLVPDLGADLVRIFYINSSTGLLEQQQSLVAPPGSGPRHAVFWSPKKADPSQAHNVRFYLVTELDNHLNSFEVTYPANGTIAFSKGQRENTYGEGSTPPVGSKAAGIAISPENNHVVISNRNDETFGPANDSIAIFSSADRKGQSPTDVCFVDLYPAYGSFPRQFEISSREGKVALALQNSHEVAIVEWNDKTGSPGSLLAVKSLDGEIPAVIWGA
ncbi:Lactonase, 7-bladed beta-propeller-domain-containing protein [Aspergillus cavernicola]|uniref:Lactonase, 7-bladed beta-propeller-domain-containing protein n=1 Tax=Aspergillus cavernicola TaxID=176166 RepID=A0ABR4HNP2_9EURO